MCGLRWLCLSPRGEGGSARAPQATFFSLTNEGGRPWVVTDTSFQLFTKKLQAGPQDTLLVSGCHLPRVSCEQVQTPPRQAGVVSNFPTEAMQLPAS